MKTKKIIVDGEFYDIVTELDEKYMQDEILLDGEDDTKKELGDKND